MAEIVFEKSLVPFNSPLETGFRSLVLLDAAYPRSFDLSALVLFDHLVVHTADIAGPSSLHPSLPHRSGGTSCSKGPNRGRIIADAAKAPHHNRFEQSGRNVPGIG